MLENVFFFAVIPLFEKGENIKTPLPYNTYFKINNNLDNLKFFEAVHEPTCTYMYMYHGDFIVYFQKLSFHSSTQTQQHHNFKKKCSL